jgi:hypothetical protein
MRQNREGPLAAALKRASCHWQAGKPLSVLQIANRCDALSEVDRRCCT